MQNHSGGAGEVLGKEEEEEEEGGGGGQQQLLQQQETYKTFKPINRITSFLSIFFFFSVFFSFWGELISVGKTSHKHSNKDLSRLR